MSKVMSSTSSTRVLPAMLSLNSSMLILPSWSKSASSTHRAMDSCKKGRWADQNAVAGLSKTGEGICQGKVDTDGRFDLQGEGTFVW